MTGTSLLQMEQNIARCRLILSFAAFVALYIDPAPPLLSRWMVLTSGPSSWTATWWRLWERTWRTA